MLGGVVHVGDSLGQYRGLLLELLQLGGHGVLLCFGDFQQAADFEGDFIHRQGHLG